MLNYKVLYEKDEMAKSETASLFLCTNLRKGMRDYG